VKVGIGWNGQHTIYVCRNQEEEKKGEGGGEMEEQQFVTVPSLIIIRPQCSSLFVMPINTRQSKAIILEYVHKFKCFNETHIM
jgi:hypothetical protein